MQYELGFFENLIYNGLSRKTPGDHAQVNEITDSIHVEVHRIKTQWKNKVFASDDEPKIERYIQGHQKELIELANTTLQFLSKEGPVLLTDTPIDLYVHPYNTVYKSLEDLLSYIEKHFSKYFNQDNTIPESYKWIIFRDCQDWLPNIKEAFDAKVTDKRLLKLACYPIEKFMQRANSHGITFRRLIFLKNLMKELSAIADTEVTGRELNYRIRTLLFYLDLNSLRSYRYSIDYITAYVNQAETMPHRLDRLAFAQKCINQSQIKPGFSYYTEYKPIKEQLSVWIEEEIKYAEKRKQLPLSFPSAAPEEMIRKDFKIKTSFSVPQLAYFIRLLVDIGVIQNKNIQELTRFFAKFVGTKKAESMSEESFRSKFYAIDDSTKSAVRETVINLLNQTRKQPKKD